MDIKEGEEFHRFVVFSTKDGKQIKIVSKMTKDNRVEAELVIEANGEESVHKFIDSINNSETFETNHFNEVLNNLKQVENGQFKKLAQKKFLGIWNFIEAREVSADEIMQNS